MDSDFWHKDGVGPGIMLGIIGVVAAVFLFAGVLFLIGGDDWIRCNSDQKIAVSELYGEVCVSSDDYPNTNAPVVTP